MRSSSSAAFALGSALVAALVACSAGSTATAPAIITAKPSPRQAGPMLSGTGQISEDENAQFSFTSPLQIVTDQQPSPAPAGLTCAQFAAGEGGSFAPPTFDVLSGNYKFYFEAVMASGYHGPGAYQSADEPSLTGTIAVDVGVAGGQQGAVSIFRSHINGSSTLTVHGDGSGTFDYSEWGSDEVRGNTGSAASVSGTVRWTCG